MRKVQSMCLAIVTHDGQFAGVRYPRAIPVLSDTHGDF